LHPISHADFTKYVGLAAAAAEDALKKAEPATFFVVQAREKP
jgi:hypothetical protein